MRRLLPVLLLVAMAACSEKPVLGPYAERPEPVPETPAGTVLLNCTVNVPTGEMRCAEPDMPSLPEGANADRIIGEQDVYVKLTSDATSYDNGIRVFRTSVTVQNLTRHLLGTPDGVAVTDVLVFFHTGPTVTGGSGTASVFNESGFGTFMGSEQPYFRYTGVLRPLEISEAKEWLFQVDPSVTEFTFGVYVSAAMVDEDAALLGSVWTGLEGSDWTAAGNWEEGDVPTATSSVSVLPLALAEGPNMPVVGSDITLEHLRVGTGSSLDLGGFEATITGNVDAVGGITNGVVSMTGNGLVGGTLPTLNIGGDVTLQRETVTTGPVGIAGGSLSISNQTLKIMVP